MTKKKEAVSTATLDKNGAVLDVKAENLLSAQPSEEPSKKKVKAKSKEKVDAKTKVAKTKAKATTQDKKNFKAEKKAGKKAEKKAEKKAGKGGNKPKAESSKKLKDISKNLYEKELRRLHIELVKLQYWVKEKNLKVAVLFEGRDAAGKGGSIKRISECLNPRICKVVALGTPTEKEKSQWYFQRYTAELPSAGEIVLFDRSWYNRAGVERVMGFCTHQEYVEFLRSCPEYEHMLQRAGIVLVKYWFSVSDEVQETRFRDRLSDPTKRWKLSPMDLEARAKWVEYSKAKDDMFAATDTTRSPWHVVEADHKRRARLNCISHLLSQIEYSDLTPPPVTLPPRQKSTQYERPPMGMQSFVPNKF